MTVELAGSLAVLALVDSLSVGTLVIPIFFLLAPGRLRLWRILSYLFAIAGFYFIVGIALIAGVNSLSAFAEAALATPAVQTAQLILGAALIALSFWIGRKRPEGHVPAPGRLARWRDRAMGDEGASAALVLLAIGAGLAELATMLPYVGAVGLLSTSNLDGGMRVVLLAAYCVVMILPALVLTAARLCADRLIAPVLQRIADWMQKNAAENTAWIVGIVGFIIAREAAVLLGLFGTNR